MSYLLSSSALLRAGRCIWLSATHTLYSLPLLDLIITVKDPTPSPGTGYFSLPSSSGIPSRRQRLIIMESKPHINMLCATLRSHRHLRPGYISRVMFALDVNAVYESSILLSLPSELSSRRSSLFSGFWLPTELSPRRWSSS